MKDTTQAATARKTFARNVRKVRRLQELSQEALALQAGLSRTYVSEVERGDRNVSIDSMGALADALDTPLKELVDPALFPETKSR
jgi:transcriptional regulator with XRE-family HTH domain